MVTASEIRDDKSLRGWLEGRPREDAVAIAARAALRVAPIVWANPVSGKGKGDVSTLAVLRSLFTCGVAGQSRMSGAIPASSRVRYATSGAYAFAHPGFMFRTSLSASDHAYMTARTAADAAFSFDPAASCATASAADHAVAARIAEAGDYTASDDAADAAGSAARNGVWKQVRRDAGALEAGGVLEGASLWSGPEPDWFRRDDARFRARWQADPAYDFWLRWWDGVVSGKQIDWALQEKVALIPDEVWQQGAEAVAVAIRVIEEQVRLLREVERLKEQLASARSEIAALSWRGHNNPPELLEPVAEIERQASEISKSLEDAAQELKSDVPRPAVLRRAGRALLNAIAKLLTYCASLGDVALRSAAVAGGPMLIATLTGHWQEVQSFAQALLAFARSLGGGWVRVPSDLAGDKSDRVCPCQGQARFRASPGHARPDGGRHRAESPLACGLRLRPTARRTCHRHVR